VYSTPAAALPRVVMAVAVARVMMVTPCASASFAICSMSRVKPPMGYMTPPSKSRWLIR